jgi:hypothetical protein
MARPPTALTIIFYHASSPEKAYDMLRAHGALSWQGIRNRSAVIEILKRVINQDETTALYVPPVPGPSTPDRMAEALGVTPYLSKHGFAMAKQQPRESDPPRPFWMFWPRS